MKLRLVLSATALAFTAIAGNPVFAQMNMDHSKMGMAACPA
jgi:Cu(I)/Ag(I) efflux system protein CusF